MRPVVASFVAVAVVICSFAPCHAFWYLTPERDVAVSPSTQPRRWAGDPPSLAVEQPQAQQWPQLEQQQRHMDADFGGVQARIARRGVDYVAGMLEFVVDGVVRGIRMQRMVKAGPLVILNASVFDYQVTDRSWIKLDQSRGITWHKDNVTVVLDAELSGALLQFRLHDRATLRATLSGVETSVSLEFFEQSGRLYLVFGSCSFQIGRATAQFTSTRPHLMPLLSLYFDSTMVKNPKIWFDTINLQFSGEISHRNGSGTLPFRRDDPPDASLVRMYNKMAYITVSDFVVNSFLYRVHEQLKFDLKLNRKEFPKMATFLSFSCGESEICLSMLFPELAELYYDHSSEVVFSKTKNAPKLIARPGVFELHWDTFLTVVAIRRSVSTNLLKIFLSIEIEFRPWFNGTADSNLLNGTVKITKFYGRLLESAVASINQEKLDQLDLLVPPAVEVLLESLLKKGLPIPPMGGLSLNHSDLRVLNRKFRLETDFSLDPQYFSRMAQDFLPPQTPPNGTEWRVKKF